MKLSELQTGEKAVIVRVHGHGSFRKRLIEMGFIQGKEVTVVLNRSSVTRYPSAGKRRNASTW